MNYVAVFGPKLITPEDKLGLFEFLDTVDRPMTIITSTCSGWDAAGLEYAKKHKEVFGLPIRAVMEMGIDSGIERCNEIIAGGVMFGVTKKNPLGRWSIDLAKKLKDLKKPIQYI